MNWLDIVILLTLVWFAFAGLSSGILRESVTFAAAVAGVLLAGMLYKQLADDLSVVTTNERAATIAAFAAIFGAVFLAGQLVATLLKRAAALLMLGPLDHLAGLAFGLLKGFVLVEAALFLFAAYGVKVVTHAMTGSFLTPFFLDGMPVLLALLPGEFRNAVDRFTG